MKSAGTFATAIWQAGRRPVVAALFAMVTGISVGYVGGLFGEHRASPEKAIPGVGRIERVTLPITARNLSDIRDVWVKMGGPDDYGRIFVNNYLVINNEKLADLLKDAPPAIEPTIRERSIDKIVHLPNDAEVKAFLRKGSNFIVAEVENSQGPCSMGIDIVVNTVPLRSFPRSLPEGIGVQVEEHAVNADLLKKFDDLKVETADGALCSRRVFEIIVD